MGKNVYVICNSEELEENIKRKNFSGKSSVVINGIDIIRAEKTNKSNYFFEKKLGHTRKQSAYTCFRLVPLHQRSRFISKCSKKAKSERYIDINYRTGSAQEIRY